MRSKKEPVIENDRITFFPVIVISSLPRPLCKLNRCYSRLFYLVTYRRKRSSNDFYWHTCHRTFPKFSGEVPANTKFGHLSNSAGTTRKRMFRKNSRDGVPRVIRGRHYETHQLFPCCHLQWPAQNEGGTDLRVSRTIITQAERHAVARFMGHIMARHLNDYLLLNVNGL